MLLSLLMVLVPSEAHAGCKVEEKRDLDGSALKTAYMFADEENGALGIISGNGGLLLHVPLWQLGQADAPLQPGGLVKFLLEDGTTFQLTLPEMVAPKSSLWGSTDILTTWDAKLPITIEQVGMLAASRIEAMEIPTVGQPTRIDTGKSPWKWMAKKTQKLGECWEAETSL